MQTPLSAHIRGVCKYRKGGCANPPSIPLHICSSRSCAQRRLKAALRCCFGRSSWRRKPPVHLPHDVTADDAPAGGSRCTVRADCRSRTSCWDRPRTERCGEPHPQPGRGSPRRWDATSCRGFAPLSIGRHGRDATAAAARTRGRMAGHGEMRWAWHTIGRGLKTSVSAPYGTRPLTGKIHAPHPVRALRDYTELHRTVQSTHEVRWVR